MAAGIEDAFLRAWALSAIASAQAEAGDIAGPLQTVAGIEHPYPRVVALSEIASTQAKLGMQAEGAATFAEALKTAADKKNAFWRPRGPCPQSPPRRPKRGTSLGRCKRSRASKTRTRG